MSPSPVHGERRGVADEVAETDLDAIEPDFLLSSDDGALESFGPNATILALSPPNPSCEFAHCCRDNSRCTGELQISM